MHVKHEVSVVAEM